MRITSNGNVNIGTSTEYSTATKMNIKGASYGYSQPLVRIEQTAGWDGNYCLQTVRYTDLGGIRINGGDLGNSIFKTAATGDMGFTVNNGNMLFNVNGSERMRITSAGNVSCTGSLTTTSNIDCGGGIAINGSTAFYNPSNTIDSGNLTNTYMNLKFAGTNNDWCYMRQIGGDNAYKLAFDFHDDVDARFCIRSITSTANPDTVTEVFTVDNGNVSCTGNITTTAIKATSNWGIITMNNVFVRTGYYGGTDYNSTNYSDYIGGWFAGGGIFVQGNIFDGSDIRIKKDINDINDDSALQQILSIQPKTYKYIDEIGKGKETVYGFIAQQVKEVIPLAVSEIKETIPNIYKKASCNGNKITLDEDVSQELKIDDTIKIYTEDGKEDLFKVTNVNSNMIEIDKEINTEKIFIYGKEINDFHSLKKDYIFTLNVCATQELYKIIQKQETIINDLISRIAKLENQNL